jgi:hypothetical protein
MSTEAMMSVARAGKAQRGKEPLVVEGDHPSERGRRFVVQTHFREKHEEVWGDKRQIAGIRRWPTRDGRHSGPRDAAERSPFRINVSNAG